MHRRLLVFVLLAGLLASEAIAESCPPPFLLAWGDPGSPMGLAVDASGNVYVANGGWRVQVFDANGVFLRQWGTFGTHDGQFTQPEDVAVDGQGYVYVTDSGRSRVQKFTGTGTFVTTWGTGGSGDGQFNGCNGIAADAAGSIYVVDNGNCRVQKFTSNGAFLLKWGSCGGGAGQFQVDGARGIAIDQQGDVYVSDALGSRVQEFTSTGAYVGTLGTQGVTFTDPYAVDVDAGGRIYVACNADISVRVVANDGTPICTWGSAGSGDGQFGFLYGLSVGPSGNVYVSDAGNGRIDKFGDVPTATLRSTWGKLRTLYR